MTSAGNYAVIIALAILIAAGASLTYVLYVHFTTPTPTPQQTTTITTPTTTPTAANTTTQPGPTPTASSRVLSVSLYVATPEVLKCAGLGGVYLYYFNVTVERARVEDPVTFYVFKAVAGNATYRLQTASRMALEKEFFKPYDINATQRLGVVNIYLELDSQNPLDVEAVEYLGVRYRIDKVVYVSCIKRVEFRGAYNRTLPGPGVLGLVPADKTFTVRLNLPPGRYSISAPPDVVVPREIDGGNTTLTIGLLNKPQVYNLLILNLTKSR
ncbi:hypothetical protein PYWP30_01948 [Pyrobaculum sp. WP30]|nr:hypothetical protein PYWP30_01948 [Pyrobaculum sp. WP30]